jgi:ethanolamine ammonia-lyase small subunit
VGAPTDPWRRLAALTPARIGLGRAGPGLPTREVLAFALAHARARDAVHTPLQADAVADRIAALGLQTVRVESAAPDRATYLRRPDLGRRLSPAARDRLSRTGEIDLALVVADGLSSAAVHAQAAEVIAALCPHAARLGWRLGARAVAVLIGERPGLSAPDSLGVYLTHAPRPGRTDAERNCISNIHARGLSAEAAAFKLAWLTAEALRRQLTGVDLKDESDIALIGGTHPRLG